MLRRLRHAGTKLVGRHQIDGKVILENFNVRLRGDSRQQRTFDFAPSNILGMKDAAFRMSALFAEVQFARAVRTRDLAFGKVHAQFDQFPDPGRAFLDNRADNVLFAQARAGFERVAHVKLD